MAMSPLEIGALAALSVAAIVLGELWRLAKVRRLEKWAADEGMTILKRQRWKLGDVPAELQTWGRDRDRGCYYVTVKDREGNVFSAWIVVGGLIEREPRVVWDNRPAYLRR